MKITVPTAFSTSEIMYLFFVQAGLLQFCKARVNMPKSAIENVTTKYAILICVEISVSDKRETSCTVSPIFCPKSGRRKNKSALTSSSPKISSQRWFCFCLASCSAMVSTSSVDRSSSTVTEKNLAISFSDSMFGYPLPVSRT